MSTPLHLVIFGRQGAGKGTQSLNIAEAYGCVHVSTGDMLRAAIAAETEMGKAVKAILDSGALVDDDTMEGLVDERLSQHDVMANGVLLDGFPRTPAQAEALVTILGDRTIDAAINLDVPIEEVTERMLARGRNDDTPEAIAQRLELYESQTRPLLDWFDDRGLLEVIDGIGSEDDVFARIRAVLDERRRDSQVVTDEAEE